MGLTFHAYLAAQMEWRIGLVPVDEHGLEYGHARVKVHEHKNRREADAASRCIAQPYAEFSKLFSISSHLVLVNFYTHVAVLQTGVSSPCSSTGTSPIRHTIWASR